MSVFLLLSWRGFAQDTLLLNAQFEEVQDIAQAQYLEIKLCDKADTNRCMVLRQRSNGDYLSLEKYGNYNEHLLHGRCRRLLTTFLFSPTFALIFSQTAHSVRMEHGHPPFVSVG
ncbi:MAG: hypothetical protein ABIQ93_04385 [Saprospiraceae bacterium]